jgi:hypothetical protein
MEACFDLNGAGLRVLADDSALLDPLLPYLGELGAQPGMRSSFLLDVTRKAHLDPPPEAELLFDGPLPEGPSSQLLVEPSGTRWLVVPGQITLRIAPDAPTARMSVRPGREALIGGSVGIHLIETVLRRGGQHLLHAAALQQPGREGALLLFAPSGAGKTTTALALALDGFGLLADDASVIIPASTAAAGHHRVWGLPRSLKVHQATAAMLPRIGALLADRWNREGEQVLTRHALRSVADVGAPRPRRLAAVVVLWPRVSGGHQIVPIKRSDALVQLAADNVFRAPRGVLADGLQCFDSLSRIVSDVATYKLSVGSDLSRLGHVVMSALA